jgi:malate permease and related proteins
MDLLAALADVVFPVFAVIAIGYVWDLSGKPFEQQMVTDLVILVGAPCLMFKAVNGDLLPAGQMGMIGLAALLCPAITALAAFAVIKYFRLNPKVYLPALTFPNVGNMGLPVCLFAFGQTGLTVAVFYLMVTNILQFTFGPAIASGKADIWGALRSPVVLATYVSLAVRFFQIPIPHWVNNGVSLLSDMVIPLMLLSLGVALSRFKVVRFSHTFGMSTLRIGLGMLVGWGVAKGLGLSQEMAGAVIVESSMPVAVFNYLYAEMYGNDPHEVAGMVMVSTFLSIISLPVLITVLNM